MVTTSKRAQWAVQGERGAEGVAQATANMRTRPDAERRDSSTNTWTQLSRSLVLSCAQERCSQ